MNIFTLPSALPDPEIARCRALAEAPPRCALMTVGEKLIALSDARRAAALQRLAATRREADRAVAELRRAETGLARQRNRIDATEREWQRAVRSSDLYGRDLLDVRTSQARDRAQLGAKVDHLRLAARHDEAATRSLAHVRQESRAIGRRHEKLQRWLEQLRQATVAEAA